MVGKKKVIKLNYNDEELIEKLNHGFKTRNRIYISVTIITVLMLLPYIPFWFNITNAMHTFGIGYYHTEKEYVKTYGNETAGIHIELDITRTKFSDTDIPSGLYQEEFGYMVKTTVYIISSENIIPIGFSSKLQFHQIGEQAIESDSEHYDPPCQNLDFSTGYPMEKEEICNSSGWVTYHLFLDLHLYNESLFYHIDYTIPFNDLDYANLNLIFYLFLGLYLFFIVFVPFLFHKIIKPVFGVKFDIEDIEREKKFRNFIEYRKTQPKYSS